MNTNKHEWEEGRARAAEPQAQLFRRSRVVEAGQPTPKNKIEDEDENEDEDDFL